MEFLYYLLGTSGIVAATLIGYAAYEVAITARQARRVLEDIEDTTSDVSFVKNTLKVGILSFITKMMNKGGEEK